MTAQPSTQALAHVSIRNTAPCTGAHYKEAGRAMSVGNGDPLEGGALTGPPVHGCFDGSPPSLPGDSSSPSPPQLVCH